HPREPMGQGQEGEAPAELRRGDDTGGEPFVSTDGDVQVHRSIAQAADAVGERGTRHLLAALVDGPQFAGTSRQGLAVRREDALRLAVARADAGAGRQLDEIELGGRLRTPSRSQWARSGPRKRWPTTSPKSSSTRRPPRAPSLPMGVSPDSRRVFSPPSAIASGWRSLVPEQTTRKWA